MGQYYKVVNLTKREYLSDINYGTKLMEFSYVGNSIIETMIALLLKEWKGDDVIIVGDYAYTDDDYHEVLKKLAIKNGLKPNSSGHYDFYNDSYYGFKKRRIRKGKTNHSKLYFVNHTKQEYFNPKELPYEWIGTSIQDYKKPSIGWLTIAPIAMLLAIGNGLGGGDYHECQNFEYLGSYASDDIEIIKNKNNLPQTYKEVQYLFTESGSNNNLLPTSKKEYQSIESFKKDCGMVPLINDPELKEAFDKINFYKELTPYTENILKTFDFLEKDEEREYYVVSSFYYTIYEKYYEKYYDKNKSFSIPSRILYKEFVSCLTNRGFEVFSKINLKSFRFPVKPIEIKGRSGLKLNFNLRNPGYLESTTGKNVVFKEEELSSNNDHLYITNDNTVYIFDFYNKHDSEENCYSKFKYQAIK